MNNIYERLEELSKLEDGWDGPGTSKISPLAIEKIKGLYLYPTREGGLSLEMVDWDSEVEIEISPKGKINCVLWERNE